MTMWQQTTVRQASTSSSKSKQERRAVKGKNTAYNNGLKPSTSSTKIGAVGSDSYVTQLDITTSQNRLLKSRCEKLERENADLKQSVYRLSYLLSQAIHQVQAGQSENGSDKKEGVLGTQLLSQMESSLEDIKSEELDLSLRRGISSDHRKSNKAFHKRLDLTGHTGSVYTVKFSSNGKLVASGSFDKTVRIWDVDANKRKGTEIVCLKEHSLNVSDVCWSNDSSELLSGAYDSSVKLWDVEKGTLVRSFNTPGFVQSVIFEPRDNNLIFVGTTKKKIVVFDKRSPEAVNTIENSTGMVNCVTMDQEGQYLFSGDSQGYIKMWSVGEGKCIRTTSNDGDKHKPISYISLSNPSLESSDQMFAVNSYDNMLRVYDYEPRSVGASGVLEEDPLRAKYKLSSHKNKNWPIKSSFFVGRNAKVGHASSNNPSGARNQINDVDEK